MEDIHDNLQTLRVRSRDLTMGVLLAAGALKTYRTNVVGSGLTPKPVIDREAAGLSEEQADALEKEILREFNLWADSPNCDGERASSFYELQQVAFYNWLMSGDCFAIPQMKQRAGWPYETCIQLVEADRVCTPGDAAGIGLETDEKIINGVEVDESGQVVAYWIAKHHPLSARAMNEKNDWTRVEAYGARTGRRNVLHLMMKERLGQRRGVPILAPVIESLKQLGRYTDAELMAVVNGFPALLVTPVSATTELPIGEAAPEEALVDSGDKNTIELGAGSIIDLNPGETVTQVTPGRPNAQFDQFVTSIARQIGAALELPYEILVKQFSSNYSTSRAALLEAWKAFLEWRDWMVEKFCQPVYEEWLSEAVAKGRGHAPGYFTDPAKRKAYTRAEWYGPTQGQLDPTKEVTAAEARVKAGFSSRTKEAMELTGTDFLDNMKSAKRETELMKEAFGEETTGTAKEEQD
ncbi:MAG: phage portal protein [Oscillospiraceae bacterium]|nr:phage portal protein [Oscillospiraceae bacterium]